MVNKTKDRPTIRPIEDLFRIHPTSPVVKNSAPMDPVKGQGLNSTK